jgi:hypothetical protein
MKTIYKLISIFMILILVSTGIGIAANAKDNQKKNMTYPSGGMPAIDKSAKPLPVTTYDGAIFNKKIQDNKISIFIPGNYTPQIWNPGKIINMTFVLPFNGFVTIIGGGQIQNYEPGWAEVFLVVDNPYAVDYSTFRSVDMHGVYPTGPDSGIIPGEGFETTGTYYLTKGTHTIYMNGMGNVSNCQICQINVRYASLTVIASNKGSQTVI